MAAKDNSPKASQYNWKGRTILIAEDIDFNYVFLESVLKRTEVRILWAKNGVDAVNLFKAHTEISLVLMDMKMPVMDGHEATREILKIRPDAYVIAQTAYVQPDEIKAYYEDGCKTYLAKPVRREDLFKTLAEYFENSSKN